MLIRFSIENFLSFRDRVIFSMIPGKGTLKTNHKSKPIKGISTLKTSVIFGANASGKSNLVKAIHFGKKIIVGEDKNEKQIIFQNFKLDSISKNSNSRIEYEFQKNEKNYAYGFVFNHERIIEEWLYEITKKSQSKIFERNLDKFDLSPLLKKNKKEEHKLFLKFIAKGTQQNQLFLSEIRSRRVKENVNDVSDLLNVIDWFQNSLKVILPDDKYKQGVKFQLKDDSRLQMTFEELLKYFDTGVNGICLEKTEIENIEFPLKILEDIKEELLSSDSDSLRAIVVSLKNTTYFVSKNDNEIIIYKFMTKHNIKGESKLELFDTSDESDGTNRIIDFIPLIMDLLQGDAVFVIDEMERSLHPNLIYDLFDLFLSRSENINSQLIVASHESSLLTQKLLRKDEIWFVVKDKEGSSKIHSLEEYNIRFDKEIRKDYLLGRFKAIPRIGDRSELTVLPNQN